MAVHAIAHVELYTRDKKPVVDYLVSVLGFARAADSVDVDRSSSQVGVGRAELSRCAAFYRGVFGFRTEPGHGGGESLMVLDETGSVAFQLSGPSAGPVAGGRGARYLAMQPLGPKTGRTDPVGPIRSAADAPGLSVIPSAPESSRELAPAVAR